VGAGVVGASLYQGNIGSAAAGAGLVGAFGPYLGVVLYWMFWYPKKSDNSSPPN
jgi:hypothetical protein